MHSVSVSLADFSPNFIQFLAATLCLQHKGMWLKPEASSLPSQASPAGKINPASQALL